MHARRVLIAFAVVAVLSACGGSPSPSDTDQSKGDKSTLPRISAGTVMPEALAAAHCSSNEDGRWKANGSVKNPTDRKLSFEVLIHVGPANGKDGRAHVQAVDDLKPGKSADWSVSNVSADDPDGPCQIQVRVAK